MAKDNRTFPITSISAEDENKLWENAIFVWDTSAICALYGLTPTARDTLLAILRYIVERIWIPARVFKEYKRHKDSLIQQPIEEHYSEPEFLSVHYISRLDEFISKLKSESYYHPVFESAEIERLEGLRNKADDAIQKIRMITQESLSRGKEIVKESAKDDKIFSLISSLEIGEPFSARDLMEIIKEGHIRYFHKIPPGYMDSGKASNDKFGDLIIWKEVCNYATVVKSPVIFITNDLKEDWNASNPKRNELIPREELLEEFKSQSGQDIWSYTLNGFISNLKKYYVHHPELQDSFDSLTAVLKELDILDLPDDNIKVICQECHEVVGYDNDEFCWDWEFASSDEREMGSELTFESEDYFECPQCGAEHHFCFSMYQYPLNVVNYVGLDVDGCDVVTKPPLKHFIEYKKYDCCVRCGECIDDVNEDGYCQACMDEFDYECNKDD